MPTREAIEDIFAEIRELITRGTREDHKTLASADALDEVPGA
jgi:hypothetical protein